MALAKSLVDSGYKLLASGGTANYIKNDAKLPVTCVEEFTGAPEILGGRVKTLHPAIHGGNLIYINIIFCFTISPAIYVWLSYALTFTL